MSVRRCWTAAGLMLAAWLVLPTTAFAQRSGRLAAAEAILTAPGSALVADEDQSSDFAEAIGGYEWDDDPTLLDALSDEGRGARSDVWWASWFDSVSGWNGDAVGTGPGVAAHQAGLATVEYETWQVLPAGLLYRAYLAGEKEPRIAWSLLHARNRGPIWEAALGGRVGLLRHGTVGAAGARGWQLDLEGAALPRIDPTLVSTPLESCDYRVGMQWTRRRGAVAVKVGYYHISSHLGDEFLLNNPGFVRLNYVRDSLIFGVMRDVTPDVQVYGEVGYAVGVSDGAEPLEVQFGVQYLPIADTGLRGSPFAAINAHLREDVDFGGGVNIEAGWRWRGALSGHVLRVGLQYYNGKSIQYSFYDRDEQLFGGGVRFDY